MYSKDSLKMLESDWVSVPAVLKLYSLRDSSKFEEEVISISFKLPYSLKGTNVTFSFPEFFL